jgi:MarR family transcriptional regulator, lower aerobic nicotinate degradation pathway regulator
MGSHTSLLSLSLPASPGDAGRIRTVLDALRRVVRELRLSARGAERGAGISGAQLLVLQTLAHRPASSLNDLAVRTLTDQSSVSVVVGRLVDRRLVARKASRDDARRVELSVTSAGRRLLARCPEPIQARLFAALGRMSVPELESLSRGLEGLVREMGIENEEPRMFFEEARMSSEEPPARERARARG